MYGVMLASTSPFGTARLRWIAVAAYLATAFFPLGFAHAWQVDVANDSNYEIYDTTLRVDGAIGEDRTIVFENLPDALPEAAPVEARLVLTAMGDLDRSNEYIRLDIDGVDFGKLFRSDCRRNEACTDEVVLVGDQLANFVDNAEMVLSFDPSSKVQSGNRSDYIQARLVYAYARNGDTGGDGGNGSGGGNGGTEGDATAVSAPPGAPLFAVSLLALAVFRMRNSRPAPAMVTKPRRFAI